MTKFSQIKDETLRAEFLELMQRYEETMDLYTVKIFCDFICKYEFNKISSLKHLTIGLMGSIIEFNDEIKIILRKIFGVKINCLYSLNLITGICLSDSKQYLEFLDLINFNWIIQYFITFDASSSSIYKRESNRLSNLRCLVPIFWEKNLKEHKNKKGREYVKEINYVILLYLKYLFNNKYKPYEPSKPSKVFESYPQKEEMVKKMIFDILKYLYITQIPIVFHDNESKKKNK